MWFLPKIYLHVEQKHPMAQVLYPGDCELSPPNLLVVNSDPDHGYGPEHHQIPYVEGIVRSADAKQRLVLVDPPYGLLDLGCQQAALEFLEPLLQVLFFCYLEALCKPHLPSCMDQSGMKFLTVVPMAWIQAKAGSKHSHSRLRSLRRAAHYCF